MMTQKKNVRNAQTFVISQSTVNFFFNFSNKRSIYFYYNAIAVCLFVQYFYPNTLF